MMTTMLVIEILICAAGLFFDITQFIIDIKEKHTSKERQQLYISLMVLSSIPILSHFIAEILLQLKIVWVGNLIMEIRFALPLILIALVGVLLAIGDILGFRMRRRLHFTDPQG